MKITQLPDKTIVIQSITEDSGWIIECPPGGQWLLTELTWMESREIGTYPTLHDALQVVEKWN